MHTQSSLQWTVFRHFRTDLKKTNRVCLLRENMKETVASSIFPGREQLKIFFKQGADVNVIRMDFHKKQRSVSLANASSFAKFSTSLPTYFKLVAQRRRGAGWAIYCLWNNWDTFLHVICLPILEWHQPGKRLNKELKKHEGIWITGQEQWAAQQIRCWHTGTEKATSGRVWSGQRLSLCQFLNWLQPQKKKDSWAVVISSLKTLPCMQE